MVELTPEEMGVWRNNPTTRKVRQFLKDKQAEIAARWATGEVLEDNAQVYAQVYGDIADIDYADMAEFYDELKSEEEDEPDEAA